MNIAIYGIGGKMGKALVSCLAASSGAEAVCGVDKFADPKEFSVPVYESSAEIREKVDCIIDFSVREAIYDYLPYALRNKISCVIATTGFNAEEYAYIVKAAESIPVFKTANLSVGINVLLRLAKIGAEILGKAADIEIIEQHHNQKVDAPSGTALLLADGIKSVIKDTEYVFGRHGHTGKRPSGEMGIHAVRGGSVVGKHEVLFMLDNEVITLKHEAESKAVLAGGSIDAARFIMGKKPGIYDMEDMLG